MKISEKSQKNYDFIAVKNGIKYFNPNDKYIALCEAVTASHEPNCPFLGWQIGVYELVDIKNSYAYFYHVDTLLNQVPYVQIKSLIKKKISMENENRAILLSSKTFVLVKDDESNR